jgi:hypothetical protein
MIRSFFLSATFALMATVASAQTAPDPLPPVQAIMTMTIANWAEGNDNFQDIFAEPSLTANFSSNFVSLYQSKLKTVNAADGERLIDWDPVTGGQDGCPIKDVSYLSTLGTDGHAVVTVQFHAFSCFDDSPESKELQKTEFDLVLENNAYKIDDIKAGGEDSLRAALNGNQPD